MTISTSLVPGSISREIGGGRLIGVCEQIAGGSILWLGDRSERMEIWTYESTAAAIWDLMRWEPGQVAFCALCQGERGGDDPPGPWIRHQPSNRRRRHVLADGIATGSLGCLEWRHR